MATHCSKLLGKAGAALVLSLLAAPVLANSTEQRQARGEAVVRHLNRGTPHPTLEQMRAEFPFLVEATEAYALGDVWSRRGIDDKIRQLATVAAFAALGEPAFMKIHAGYALNAGVTEAELKEIVYLTTVTAGFPKAIAASQVLSDLFAERTASGAQPER